MNLGGSVGSADSADSDDSPDSVDSEDLADLVESMDSAGPATSFFDAELRVIISFIDSGADCSAVLKILFERVSIHSACPSSKCLDSADSVDLLDSSDSVDSADLATWAD